MITIVDYGVGNLGSIANMLRKIGVSTEVSSDPETIKQAEKLILPGVGAFDHAMRNLNERDLIDPLNEAVLQKKRPILGLCLGMQLLTKGSEEGNLEGLGWIEAETLRFRFDGEDSKRKIPHMGWNTVRVCKEHELFGNPEGREPRFYFAHSYYVVTKHEPDILTETDYGHPFASAVQKDNIMGVQFHPEKSHRYGLRLLANFVAADG